MTAWAGVRLAPELLQPEERDQDWYYRVYEWRNRQEPSATLADFAERTGTPSRVSREDLLGRRSGWKSVGTGLFLAQQGRADAFEFKRGVWFGPFEVLYESARAFGGENELVWTYGGAVQRLGHRSPAPGVRPQVNRSAWRLEAYPSAPGERPPLATRFAQLGLPGVVEVDRAAAFAHLEEAAALALSGQAVPARLQQSLPRKLKPSGKPGATARQVAESVAELLKLLGPPEGWSARLAAAELAGRIATGEALGRLTTGKDLGASASFGRLLAHYPPELLRDGLFCAYAGLRTEAANGHPYVPAWFCLAEHAATVGFWLAVYPAERVKSFRKAMGIRAGEEDVAHLGQMAEAFVELPGLLKTDPRQACEEWFAREGRDGLVVSSSGAGTRFTGGKAAPLEGPAWPSLDPRGLLAALGLPDLLEPGELGGGRAAEAGPDPQRREQARALLEGLPDPQVVEELLPVAERFPASLDAGLPFEEMVRRKTPSLACRLTFPTPEDARVLLADLLRTELFARQAPWTEGPELWVCGHALPLELLLAAAADVPAGTRLAFTAPSRRALVVPGRPDSGVVRYHFAVQMP